jgi:hypothetical protein
MTQIMCDDDAAHVYAAYADRDNGPLCATIRAAIEFADDDLVREIGTIVTMQDDDVRGVVYVSTDSGDAFIASMSSRSADARLQIADLNDDGC